MDLDYWDFLLLSIGVKKLLREVSNSMTGWLLVAARLLTVLDELTESLLRVNCIK